MESFVHIYLPQPYKATHSTYEWSWHVESLLWIWPTFPPTEHLTCSSFPCNKIIRWTNEEHAHLVSFFEFLPPFDPTTQYVQHMKTNWTCRVILETYPPPTLQSERFNIWRKFTYVFPQTGLPVYLYGVLTPFKGLHTWAAWFYVLSPTCLSLVLSFCWACWLHSVA